MKKNIEGIHLIIGFGLIFLVPIAQRIDNNLWNISKFLTVGYWGIVTLGFLIIMIKKLLKEYGFKKCLFNLWLLLSMLAGVVGLYGIVMNGLDDAPWAGWLVIYAALIGYINRSKLKELNR